MNAPTTPPPVRTEFDVIGTTPIRKDGEEKVTGAALFGDDIHLPGMLHGAMLRSPHPHARIISIDKSKAEALKGVRTVIIGADMPTLSATIVAAGEGGEVNMQDIADNCMARDKVFYDGHVLAAVAADNKHIAEAACALIEVEYELLTPVLNVHDAVAEGAPVLHEDYTPGAFLFPTQKALPNAGRLFMEHGDVDAIFETCDHVIEREFTTKAVHQGYIEPHISTAVWTSEDTLTIHTTTQGAFAIRDFMASFMNMPMSKIKVIRMEIGGGFGGKDVVYIDSLAAVMAKRTGRPVKIFMSRSEVLRGTGPSPETYIKIKLGCNNEGQLLAADLYLLFEAGAYPGGPIAPGTMCALTRYNVPNVRLDGYDVFLNKPKMKPYRAPGATQANFAAESAISDLAELAGIDPIDFRLTNALKPGDMMPMGFPCPPLGSIEMLNAIKTHPHYTAPLEGENRGRGISYAFWFGAGLGSSAEIRCNADGTINLTTGSADLSGTRTTLGMQAAEELGLDHDLFTTTVGDTDSVGYTFQSVGSRTTFATGIAVISACNKLLDQMKTRAGMEWEVEGSEVDYAKGVFSLKSDSSKTQAFGEICAKADHTGGPIIADESELPEGVGFQISANIVDVEVDVETGKVDILRYSALQDVGKAVHPHFVEGQMQGGTVQGIGWAMNEEYFYDEKGILRNPTLLDYRMPTSLDVPNIDCTILETPNPGHPYGVRGVGEVPIVAPPAALRDAIKNAIGVSMMELPMKPGNVLKAIWAKEGKS
ncbi:MAG: xanthine dehydrogenase family protein molybdopterin-binding subunit [Immundisolibacteraceae bacterium]|nr:xanthine dehydrogenase family protein molybdopterin-binding subunit [Immundisolibacteraceae bacterium]